MLCYLFSEPTYLFYSDQVPQLLYYALVPSTVIALIISLYVFWSGRKLLLNRLLLIISLLFSCWTIINLIEWTNVHSQVIMFVWSFSGIVLGLIALFSIYFIYVFLTKEDISTKLKIIMLILFAPVVSLATTSFNISGFNITSCDAFRFEWMPYKIYYISLSVLAMVWIFVLLIRHYKLAKVSEWKKQIVLMGMGIELFLFSFFGLCFIGEYLTRIGVLPDSTLGIYGMFGMVIFMAYISILIVRFGAFNAKLIATQALVWGLAILIGSEFFFVKVTINYFLTGITFIATIIFGQMLIRSVKKEIEQKEKLAKLNVELEGLLRQRESLVHLVTHKVKGSFTHTKYIFAGMLDGMFGPLTPELKKVADLGMESDNNGVATVDLILNAANLQKGTVKYDMKPLDFKDLVEKTYDEKKDQAEKKGLKISKEIAEGEYKINGDTFWLKEVVHNYIENAIRYTPSGEVIVGLKKENGKIIYFVHDSGIGITDEDKKNLFTEGGRGANSVKVNVDSTGYGLYTVKLVVEAHGGRVWAQSEGQGKGSTFFAELNAV